MAFCWVVQSRQQCVDYRESKGLVNNEGGFSTAGNNAALVRRGAALESTDNCRPDGDNSMALVLSFSDCGHCFQWNLEGFRHRQTSIQFFRAESAHTRCMSEALDANNASVQPEKVLA